MPVPFVGLHENVASHPGALHRPARLVHVRLRKGATDGAEPLGFVALCDLGGPGWVQSPSPTWTGKPEIVAS